MIKTNWASVTYWKSWLHLDLLLYALVVSNVCTIMEKSTESENSDWISSCQVVLVFQLLGTSGCIKCLEVSLNEHPLFVNSGSITYIATDLCCITYRRLHYILQATYILWRICGQTSQVTQFKVCQWSEYWLLHILVYYLPFVIILFAGLGP